MNAEEKKKKIKELIVSRLNLTISPTSIQDDDYLFGSSDDPNSLGLDSVDSLELAVGLMNEFGVEISDENMHIFQSVNTIEQFISSNVMASQPFNPLMS